VLCGWERVPAICPSCWPLVWHAIGQLVRKSEFEIGAAIRGEATCMHAWVPK